MWNLQHNFLGEEWPSWKHMLKHTNGPNCPHFQGAKEVSLHSTPKTLQILWPLGISVSPKSFIKSKIFPASFKVFDNEPALPTCCTKGCGKSQLRNKNYFSTKRGHYVLTVCQHIQQHLFQTEELRHKGMPVQQLSNCRNRVMFCIKRSIEMCSCCSCVWNSFSI